MGKIKKNILAALDIGTNSTLFLLAEKEASGKINPLHHEVRTNDLGRGIGDDGNLLPEVIELNINLLRGFKQIAEYAGAEEIRIAATEALRKARNADLFIRRVADELDLRVRVISGKEEAELTYHGILSGLDNPDVRILAADIGGGSSEVIYGRGQRIDFSLSLPIGAVSLDREFIHHDPPLMEEIGSLRKKVEVVLAKIPISALIREYHFVICGGTASSLACADLGLETYEPNRIAGHIMKARRIEEFIAQFASGTLSERRSIPGIGRRRAEIILPGTVIISALMKTLKRTEYLTSERGLRYGLLTT